MPEYRFSYHKPRSRIKPIFGVTASSHTHAFRRMRRFITMFKVEYVEGSMRIQGSDGRFKPVGGRQEFLQAAE